MSLALEPASFSNSVIYDEVKRVTPNWVMLCSEIFFLKPAPFCSQARSAYPSSLVQFVICFSISYVRAIIKKIKFYLLREKCVCFLFFLMPFPNCICVDRTLQKYCCMSLASTCILLPGISQHFTSQFLAVSEQDSIHTVKLVF